MISTLTDTAHNLLDEQFTTAYEARNAVDAWDIHLRIKTPVAMRKFQIIFEVVAPDANAAVNIGLTELARRIDTFYGDDYSIYAFTYYDDHIRVSCFEHDYTVMALLWLPDVKRNAN